MSYVDFENSNQHAAGCQPHQQHQAPNPYISESGHGGVPQTYSQYYGYGGPETHNQDAQSMPHQQQPQYGANASYYNQEGNLPGSQLPEDERGLGSTVTGGAAGGFAAHKMGGGKLATAGGALLGAVGMNMATHKYEQHQQQQQQYQQQPAQTVVVVPAQSNTPYNGLGGGRLGGGLGVGRLHRRIANRRSGLF